MKKNLSLLIVLTISGTAIPTTISANYCEKKAIKLENIADNEEFNASNLEILNRVKRWNKKDNKPKNNNKPELTNENSTPSTSNKNKKCNNKGNKKCPIKNKEESSLITNKSAKKTILDNIKTRSNGIFKYTNNKYNEFLRECISYFQETKNIVYETINSYIGKYIFKIKKHNVEDSYKKIPLEIEGNKIDLVLNKSNLYVDGIITYNNGTNADDKKFWYFQDSTIGKKYPQIDKNKQPTKSELKDRCKFFTKIIDYDLTEEKIKTKEDLEKHAQLLNFDSNYNTLKDGEENIKINKKNIKDAIINLSKINETNQQDLKNDFLRVIFLTAESTRFFSVRDELKKALLSTPDKDGKLYEINWQDHKDTLTSWDKNSQKYYEMKNGKEFTAEEKQKIYDISVLAVKDDEKIRKDNNNRKQG